MKHKLLYLISFIMLLPALSVAQSTPQHRIIYLWDVTYSMHGGRLGTGNKSVTVAGKPMQIVGYNPQRDIYDKILEALVKDINSQSAGSEIIVIPFNDEVIDKWEQMGTDDGKKKLEKAIYQLYNQEQTHTGISCALDYAQKKNIFSDDIPNILKILTDGEENVSTSRLNHILETWCEYAEKNHIKAYYFVLAEQALSVDLRERLEKNCITVIEQLDDVELAVSKSFVSVSPDNLMVRATEDYGKSLEYKVNFTKGEVSTNCKLRFQVEDNPYFSLDKTFQVSEGTKEVKLKPTYKMGVAELSRQMPSDRPLKYRIRITLEGEDDTVELQTSQTFVTFINKKMKTLTIKVKK